MGKVKFRACVVFLFLSLVIGAWTAQPLRLQMFIVPRVDGVVSAFDAWTGKTLWNFSTGGPLVRTSTPHSSNESGHDPFLSSLFQTMQQDGLQEMYLKDSSISSSSVSSDNTMSTTTPCVTWDALPHSLQSYEHNMVFHLLPFSGVEVRTISSTPVEESISAREDAGDSYDNDACTLMLQIVRTEHTQIVSEQNEQSRHSEGPVAGGKEKGQGVVTVSRIRVFLIDEVDCTPMSAGARRRGEGQRGGGRDSTVTTTTTLPSLSTTLHGDLQAVDAGGNLLWMFKLPTPHSPLVYSFTSDSLSSLLPLSLPPPLADPPQRAPLSLTNYKGTPYETSFGLPRAAHPQTPSNGPVDLDISNKPIWFWIATICVCTAATIWGLIILKFHQSRLPPTNLPHSSVVPSSMSSFSSLPPSYASASDMETLGTNHSRVERSASTLQLRAEHEQLQRQLLELLKQHEQQHQQNVQQTQQLAELQYQKSELQLQLLQEQLAQQAAQMQQLKQKQHALPRYPSPPTVSSPVNVAGDVLAPLSRYRADFEEKHRIGEGGFGTVFLAINKLDGVEYAVKKVCLTPGDGKENDRVLREVRYLAQLDHPNIIRYFQSWIEEDEWDEWESDSQAGNTREDSQDGEEASDEEGDDENRGQSVGEVVASMESFGRWNVLGTPESSISIGLAHRSSKECQLTLKEESDNLASREGAVYAGEKQGARSVTHLCLDESANCPGTNSRGASPVKLRKPILYIQMQYCHQGTLHHWLSRGDRVVCAKEAVAIFRQAVRGVIHIHSRNLIHRDLKPPNILICADGSVKIGDFGLSTGGPADNCPQSPTRSLSLSHTTGVGSPLYCSPEQLNGERYDAKVDIFSLGVILYEMFHVFTTQMERVSHITQLREGFVCEQTREKYPELVSLALQLVQFNPTLRPSADEILSHPFLTSHSLPASHSSSRLALLTSQPLIKS